MGHFCFEVIAAPPQALFFCLLLSYFSPIGSEQVFFAYCAVVMCALIINLSGWAYFYFARAAALPPISVYLDVEFRGAWGDSVPLIRTSPGLGISRATRRA